MNAFVKDVMTAKVISVKQETPYAAIAAALHEHRVSARYSTRQARSPAWSRSLTCWRSSPSAAGKTGCRE
jgi:hypothetical protein